MRRSVAASDICCFRRCLLMFFFYIDETKYIDAQKVFTQVPLLGNVTATHP